MADSHDAAPLGVTLSASGATFRAASRNATRLELCLLDEANTVRERIPMQRQGDDVWEVQAPLAPGTRYGLAAGGEGAGFDPSRLLLDPYAKHIEQIRFGDDPAWVSVVVADEQMDWRGADHPRLPARDLVIYEAHVKGLTQLAEFLPPEVRGTYAALGHPYVIAHLKNLGVTAIELLPIHAIGDERHLREAGLTNYWGYSNLGFFAPHSAYATVSARREGPEAIARELKNAIAALHREGIEVLLDVVYNHTAEQGNDGVTTSFRGLDNELYYRRVDGHYLDVTGCGNALDTSEPIVQRLVLDSMRHWVNEFRVDGFRFDLAVTLGRDEHHEFRTEHPLLHAMKTDPELSGTRLIAEPWDVGHGGWRTGGFPNGWMEWNDRARDRIRQFWVGDIAEAHTVGRTDRTAGEIATVLTGSSDMFSEERGPIASVNFVTAHDGFTLRDVVSYNRKHNLANGELGRDGSDNNGSWNFGEEGPSFVDEIERRRRLGQRNMLGTLCLSAGVPMITAGDEFARTQHGNNNPYNQDTPTSWVNWNLTPAQQDQLDHVRRLLEVRRIHPALRPIRHADATSIEHGSARALWFDTLGSPMQSGDWDNSATRGVQLLLASLSDDGMSVDELLIVVHGLPEVTRVRTPNIEYADHFELLWDSYLERPEDAAGLAPRPRPGEAFTMPGPSIRVYAVSTS